MQQQHRIDCLCGACVIPPQRAQPAPARTTDVRVLQGNTTECHACAKQAAAAPGVALSPHAARFVLTRRGATSLIITTACEGSISEALLELERHAGRGVNASLALETTP